MLKEIKDRKALAVALTKAANLIKKGDQSIEVLDIAELVEMLYQDIIETEENNY